MNVKGLDTLNVYLGNKNKMYSLELLKSMEAQNVNWETMKSLNLLFDK